MSNDTSPSVYHILKSFDCLEVEIVDENKIFCFTKFQGKDGLALLINPQLNYNIQIRFNNTTFGEFDLDRANVIDYIKKLFNINDGANIQSLYLILETALKQDGIDSINIDNLIHINNELEIKIENDKFFIKYKNYHPIYFLSIKNVLSFISLYHTKNSLFDDITMHSVLFSRTFNTSADELISFILEKEIINEEKYNFIKETEKKARENYKEKMMSIISKNYFEKEIKPNIDLLELEDFIDVSIVDQQCINKEDFIKSNISLSNTAEIDKILQELNQKLAIQIEDNIEKFIINDMDNEKTMMLLEPQTTHDLNTVYPLNNIHLLEKQMFEYLEHVDFTNSTLNLGTRIPVILCDSMSFKYFQLNRFFESKKHNKYGKMINKQFIYLPYLDEIKYKYKDILQNKVDKDKLPSLFIVVSYNTNNDNPIKLITTMPQQLDKLNELEYYYKLSFVETGGVETDDSHSIFPDDADAPEKAPTLKYVKKRRTLVCPIFLQFDKNWSALY